MSEASHLNAQVTAGIDQSAHSKKLLRLCLSSFCWFYPQFKIFHEAESHGVFASGVLVAEKKGALGSIITGPIFAVVMPCTHCDLVLRFAMIVVLILRK